MVGPMEFVRTRVFLLFGFFKTSVGMVRGSLGWGLPYRLGQVLHLNVGLRPVLVNRCTSEVPICRRAG